MSARFPHRPGDLNVGDVFTTKASAPGREFTVIRKQRVDQGFNIKVAERSSAWFYHDDEPIRIIRRAG